MRTIRLTGGPIGCGTSLLIFNCLDLPNRMQMRLRKTLGLKTQSRHSVSDITCTMNFRMTGTKEVIHEIA